MSSSNKVHRDIVQWTYDRLLVTQNIEDFVPQVIIAIAYNRRNRTVMTLAGISRYGQLLAVWLSGSFISDTEVPGYECCPRLTKVSDYRSHAHLYPFKLNQ